MHLARLSRDQSDRSTYRGTRAPITLGVSHSVRRRCKTQQVLAKIVARARYAARLAYRDRLQGRRTIDLEPAPIR